MRNGISGFLVVLCCGALLAGGCAKKEVVKSEAPMATTQSATKAAPRPAPVIAPEAPPAPAVTGEGTKAQPPAPVTETPTREAAIPQESAREAMETSEAVASELQKIYFDFDSSALSQQARDTLTKNAEYLKRRSGVKVRIEGNCDERGSDEYNMALGERRAQSARDYLVNLGIAPDRLSIISYGLEKPADPGHDEAAWAKNRRDEFVVIK